MRNKIYIFITIIFAGILSQAVLAPTAFATIYVSTGTTTSTNILSGSSASIISNFHYNLSSLPTSVSGNSSASIQFSNDNTNWYSAANVLNSSTTLATLSGADISLLTLNWSGASFYYRIIFNSTGDFTGTPTIEDIRLDYAPAVGYATGFSVESNGNTGFGTAGPASVPGSKLSVSGGLAVGLDYFTSSAPFNGLIVEGYTGIGTAAPTQKLDVAGFINTDQYSGYMQAGQLLAYASTTNFDTLFGIQSGGPNAVTSATAGYNTSVGYQALFSDNTGINNSVQGYRSLFANTSGSYNTAEGASALVNSTSASNNTAIGYQSLRSNTTGASNTALGYQAGYSLTTGSNNIFIGQNVDATSSTAIGELNIGNVLFGTGMYTGATVSGTAVAGGMIGIGTTSPQGLLDVSGSSASTVLTDFVGARALSIVNTNTTNGNANGLDFRTMNTVGTLSSGAKIMGVYNSHAVNGISADLAFLNKNNGGLAETMRLTSAGNLGIGSTSPWARLSIAATSTSALSSLPLFAVSTSTSLGTSTAFLIDNNGNVALGYQPSVLSGNALNVFGQSYFGNFVGIGTSTPNSLLSLYQPSSDVALSFGDSNTTNFTFGTNYSASSTLKISAGAGLGTNDLITISPSQTSFQTPGSFEGAGDVSIAYDLVFDNPTASYIKSSGPLYLESGESFNSSDLTLRTFNSGNIIFDAGDTGGTIAQASSTSAALSVYQNGALGLSNGPIAAFFASSTEVMRISATATGTPLVGIGTTSPQGLLDISNADSSTDLTTFVGGRALSLINTDTTANNASGLDFRTMDTNGLLTTGAKIFGVYTNHTAGAVTGDLAFLTRNGATIAEKMRLTAAGNLGIGTTSPWARFSIAATSTSALSSIPLFAVSTSTASATSTAFIIDSNGKVGIGTSSPSVALSVSGDTLFGNSANSTMTFNGGIFAFANAGTTTIRDNILGAWSIATSTAANTQPIISIQTSAGNLASTTINGGLTIGNGSLMYDFSSGLTSISGLQTSGGETFDTDAGMVSWADMPQSAALVGTVQGYSANLGGIPVLTIYGLADGSGGIGATTTTVAIGTSTPYTAGLTVWGNDTLASTRVLDVINNASTSVLTAFNDGSVAIGGSTSTTTINGYLNVNGTGANATSTIAGNLWVKGRLQAGAVVVGDLTFANNFSIAESHPMNDASTTQGLLLKNQNGDKVMVIDDKGNVNISGDICSNSVNCVNRSINALSSNLSALASSTQLLQSGMSSLGGVATTTANSVQSMANAIVALNTRADELGLRVDALTSIASSTEFTSAIASALDQVRPGAEFLATTSAALASSTEFNSTIASSTSQSLIANAEFNSAISSSTEKSLTSSNSFIQAIATAVQSLIQSAGNWVVDRFTARIAYVDRIEAKTVAISQGLEIVDQNTAAVWCVTIKNGDWNKVLGSCGPSTSSGQASVGAASPTPSPTPTPNNQTPIINNQEITNNQTTPTPSPSISPEVTATPTATPTASPTPSPTIEPTPSPSETPVSSPEPVESPAPTP